MRDDLEADGTLGGIVPAFAADKPELDMWDEYYLKSFFTLDGSRSIGMSAGMIPYSEISHYWHDNPDDDFDMFVRIIQQVDAVYLKVNRPKEDKK